jgi:2-polyprenyl-3-methyl-5-hydroxy-6-metoxy-1,4-benzoquinol methylase
MSEFKWGNFWYNQKRSFDAVMTISTRIFAMRAEKLFSLKPSDLIFDYGSGPGFLSDYLEPKKISVTGADINKFYLEQSRQNHPHSLFIHISTDIESNKKILESELKQKTFDFIILLSIVQYFENTKEVETVLRTLLPYLKKSGKLIIADVIDQKSSAIRDAIALFFQCAREGKILDFFRFITYLVFSNYSRISREARLLKLSEEAIHKMARENLLNYRQVKGLTIHPSRTNYILTREE